MRASPRVWSGGTGKHGGPQRGTVYVREAGDPAVPAPRRVVLACGGARLRHSWEAVERPTGDLTWPPGSWLRCRACGMYAPESQP